MSIAMTRPSALDLFIDTPRSDLCLYWVYAHLLLSMHSLLQMSASAEQSTATVWNSCFAVVDSVRENGVQLNANPYDTSKCIRPVCGDSPPRLELCLYILCGVLIYCIVMCSQMTI